MAVRSKLGRFRYIAFCIKGRQPVSRTMFITELNRALIHCELKTKPWLVIFENNHGLLRCSHTDKEKCIQLLKSLGDEEWSVETIGTSGTIKKAKTKYLRNHKSSW